METLTLVIIEDEEAHFSLMKRAIAKDLPNASVYHFQEPTGCLKSLDEIIATVIITDYLMPGMNGIEFLEALNQQDIDIPVIMITGQGDEDIAVHAMKLGAKDYLVKSGDFFTLLPSVIKKVIRESELKESLRESERRFQDLAENTSDWLWEMDVQGRYIYSNPLVEGILGYCRYEVVGKYFYDFYSNEEKEALKNSVFQIVAEVKPITAFDNILIRKDRLEVSMETSGVPFFDKVGNLLGYRGVSRDISARKQTEDLVHNLSQMLMQAQELERQMISYELHDRIAQNLSTLKIGCDMLFDGQSAISPELRGKTAKFSKLIEQTITAVRDLSYDLRPPGLDDMGLVKALEIYCEEFSENSGVKVDFQSAGIYKLNLDFSTEIHLYRLVQEGLNNIRKHAAADQATIRLVGASPNIILRIEDNGKGFDVEARKRALNSEKRMGLRSMRERANLLQGNMEIQSRPMQGTKISIKIPFNQQINGSEKEHNNH